MYIWFCQHIYTYIIASVVKRVVTRAALKTCQNRRLDWRYIDFRKIVNVGLDPTTFCLLDRCSSSWANQLDFITQKSAENQRRYAESFFWSLLLQDKAFKKNIKQSLITTCIMRVKKNTVLDKKKYSSSPLI